MEDNKKNEEITKDDLNEFLDGLLEKGIFTDYIEENRDDLVGRMDKAKKEEQEGIEMIFDENILKDIY